MRRVLLCCAVVASAWGCAGGHSSPPTIADLYFFPDTVAALHAERTVAISGSFHFQGGVAAVHVRSATWELVIPVNGAGGATSGTISGSFQFDVPPGPGTYPFDLWVTDGDGRSSNTLRGELVVVPDRSCAHWTRIATGSTGGFRAAIWTGTRFVVVGESDAFLTSEDAVAWVWHSFDRSFRAIASSGTTLVGVGPAGTIVTSADGLDWILRTCPVPDADLEAVTWAGDRFVAVGGRLTSATYGYHDPVVVTSPDGETWTAQAVSLPQQRLRSVAWSGVRLVAGSESDYGGETAIIASDDGGVTWVSPEVLSGSPYPIVSVSWIGSEFIALRQDAAMLRSADGQSWSFDWIPMQYVHAATWTGDDLVAVGFGIASGGLAPGSDPWGERVSGFADEGGWLAGGLQGVTWSGLQCVAVGNGILLTSP